MKVFEVHYVGYHTPCLVVAETAALWQFFMDAEIADLQEIQ